MFSMSQRVALAQMQLQLAQAAPEQHNLQEAYRRMYQALNVQNIEHNPKYFAHGWASASFKDSACSSFSRISLRYLHWECCLVEPEALRPSCGRC